MSRLTRDATGDASIAWTSNFFKVPKGYKYPAYGDMTDTTFYAVCRDTVAYSKYTFLDEMTMYVGETVPFPITIALENADYSIIGISHDASVAKQTMGGGHRFPWRRGGNWIHAVAAGQDENENTYCKSAPKGTTPGFHGSEGKEILVRKRRKTRRIRRP